ncbi:LysE family translocator [Mariniluteicoccus endophyticus]
MVDPTVLPAFLAVILLFLLPPGPDMLYMLAVGIEGGRRAALRAILGIGTGMAVYAAAVALGVAGVAQAYPWLIDAIRLLGAAYLVWLAWSTLRTLRSASDAPQVEAGGRRWFGRGLLISLTNPKIILFFLAVLPGFLGNATSPGLQLAMLGAVNVATEVVLYGAIGQAAGTLGGLLTRSRRTTTVLNGVAAAVYLLLAIWFVVDVLRA